MKRKKIQKKMNIIHQIKLKKKKKVIISYSLFNVDHSSNSCSLVLQKKKYKQYNIYTK